MTSSSPGVSSELQIGKAGEHLVCCDLIMQGYLAFLADQGVPYDVIVDIGGRALRIQVKTTQRLVTYGKSKNVYRFGTRKAKGSRARTNIEDIDLFAFVVLDTKTIAYWTAKQTIGKTGLIKQTLEFRSRLSHHDGKLKQNGNPRKNGWGANYLEDFQRFPIEDLI